MTTETAVHNVQAYIMMLESGQPTKTAKSRAYKAIGYLQTNANYMKYGNYEKYGEVEEAEKAREAEKGADITPLSEILKASRKGIEKGTKVFI